MKIQAYGIKKEVKILRETEEFIEIEYDGPFFSENTDVEFIRENNEAVQATVNKKILKKWNKI